MLFLGFAMGSVAYGSTRLLMVSEGWRRRDCHDTWRESFSGLFAWL